MLKKDVQGAITARLVMGFNHLRFDYHVLSAYSDADFWSAPNMRFG